MNEMMKAADQRRRALDHQGRRREAVPVREVRRRSGQKHRHDFVRARLLDGLAADLRSAGAGAAGFLGDGLFRPPRLRLLVRRHGGLWPLDQGPRQQRADQPGRRRLLRRRTLYPEAARQAPVSGLRHFIGRAARGDVRRAPSRDGGAPCARRHGVDRRRLAHARAAPQEAARVHRQEPPPDRQGLHPLDLRRATIPTPPRRT